MSEIITEIKNKMQEKHISTQVLSNLSNVPLRTIQRILKDGDGKTSNIVAMCSALDIMLGVCEKPEKTNFLKDQLMFLMENIASLKENTKS